VSNAHTTLLAWYYNAGGWRRGGVTLRSPLPSAFTLHRTSAVTCSRASGFSSASLFHPHPRVNHRSLLASVFVRDGGGLRCSTRRRRVCIPSSDPISIRACCCLPSCRTTAMTMTTATAENCCRRTGIAGPTCRTDQPCRQPGTKT